MIRSGGVSMKTHVATATVNRPAINKVSRASAANKANKANKDNADRKARKVSRDKTANKVNAASRVSRVLKVDNSKVVSRQAAPKMAVSQTATATAAASIAPGKWAVTGATIVNSPPRFANDCAKRRIFDASGARPAWAPDVSTK